MAGDFKGLPAEFCPPRAAAWRIADLPTEAARLAYFDRIPAVWQAQIKNMAVLAIASTIVTIDDLEVRRLALTRVPVEWRETVRTHVARLWENRKRKVAA